MLLVYDTPAVTMLTSPHHHYYSHAQFIRSTYDMYGAATSLKEPNAKKAGHNFLLV